MTSAEEEERKKAEYAKKYRDEPTLAARSRLHHVVTNQHKVEERAPLDKETEEKLRISSELSAHNIGKARFDDPDTLRTLLKYYSHDIEKKRAALLEFFGQWSCEELDILESVAKGQTENSQPSNEGDATPSVHPFIRKAGEWRGIAQSHGALFLQLLNQAREQKLAGEAEPTPMDLLSVAFYQLKCKKENERKSKADLEGGEGTQQL